VFEVLDNYFIDDTPIYQEDDPYVVRFKVKPIVWLPIDKSMPVFEPRLWDNLSFTGQGHRWTMMVRGSLRQLEAEDGQLLENTLIEQGQNEQLFPLTDEDLKKLKRHKIRTQESKEVIVSVPEDSEVDEQTEEGYKTEVRESIKIQALLAEIGQKMGFKIWLPNADRNRVLEVWQPEEKSLLRILPLNYDETTLKTIENIDVLWVKRRSIVRAFEVEHTTSIYSGILRMADLMALQPNMAIKAHIVAPEGRKDKVLQEISRPVFSLLESGPLADSCTFLSYDSVHELHNEKRLEYLNEHVLEEFTETAEI
jgi:hypothetical protein